MIKKLTNVFSNLGPKKQKEIEKEEKLGKTFVLKEQLIDKKHGAESYSEISVAARVQAIKESTEKKKTSFEKFIEAKGISREEADELINKIVEETNELSLGQDLQVSEILDSTKKTMLETYFNEQEKLQTVDKKYEPASRNFVSASYSSGLNDHYEREWQEAQVRVANYNEFQKNKEELEASGVFWS